MKERIIKEANYMIMTNDTIRGIAKVFNVSKSTVHMDLNKRLYDIDKKLYERIKCILNYHTSIRHVRGGEATRKKYENLI